MKPTSMTRIGLVGVVLASLAGTACLQKETTSTIYLRQDGSLDWVVAERDVRSNATEPVARNDEEAEYLEAAARGEHGVAVAFRALGAQDVRTQVLRDTRPYAVRVEAAFASLTGLVEPPLAACGVPYHTDVTRADGVTTWTLEADLSDDSHVSPEGCDQEFEGLFEAIDVVIVLDSGRFTNAVGFTIQGQDRAVPDEHATDREVLDRTNGWLVVSLSWTGLDERR